MYLPIYLSAGSLKREYLKCISFNFVKNNASLLSESLIVTWVKSLVELATTVHGEYLEAKKEKPELAMPAILGADLMVSLFQAASLADAKAVAVACLESTLPQLLGEKIRLLVKGPPKVENSEEVPPESPKKGQADQELAQGARGGDSPLA